MYQASNLYSKESRYQRDLNADVQGYEISIGATDLCFHRCAETPYCRTSDVGDEDGICFQSQPYNVSAECCILITNDTYTQLSMDFRTRNLISMTLTIMFIHAVTIVII